MLRQVPNILTFGRLVLTIVFLIMVLYAPAPDAENRAFFLDVAFVIFVIAGLTDVVDGPVARRLNVTSKFGRMVDPLADKLLLVATLIPFLLLTARHPELGGLPLFGGVSLWVLIVFFGREALITWLRTAAARRGIVVPANTLGKRKALAQNIFIGSMVLWIAYRTAVQERSWSGPLNDFWEGLHGWFTTVSLIIALLLTVISLVVYLVGFSRVLRGAEA